MAWRNKTYGTALEFVWSSEGEYAVKETKSSIKIFSKDSKVCFLTLFLTVVFSITVSSNFVVLADVFVNGL